MSIQVLVSENVFDFYLFRSQFLMGYPLSVDEIAFSDPTPDG